MNQYKEMKKRHQKDLDNFPFFVALKKEQLKNGLKKIGLTEKDQDKLVLLKNGVCMAKENLKSWGDMLISHQQEKATLIKNDKTGTGFIYDMFFTELNNHEFGYDRDLTRVIEELGYTSQDIENSPALKNGLNLAKEKIIQLENEKEELGFEYE